MKLSRREMLKTSAAALAAFSVPSLSSLRGEEMYRGGAPDAEKIGWRVGCQLYSFHTKSFQEAVEMNASIGLKVAEAYPTHRLTPTLETGLTPDLSAADKKLVQTILADNGVTLHGFGVTSADRKTFEFVREMGSKRLPASRRWKNGTRSRNWFRNTTSRWRFIITRSRRFIGTTAPF